MANNPPLKDLISLSGKGAIVTGGAQGIGLAISRRLAEAGAKVLIADLNAIEAQKAAIDLNALGYHVHSLQCDVASEEDVKAMVSKASDILGTMDILVNNAGIYPRKHLLEMSGQEFERVLSINLTGTFLCSRFVAQEMIKSGRDGSIINLASIEAVHPSSSGMCAYDASKGGVLMLTKSMAQELGPHNIRVNAIAPGGTKTQGVLSHTRSSRDRAQFKEFKSFLARIALGRLGDSDDIARVALFLASDLSAYVTGDLIVADGGYLVS